MGHPVFNNQILKSIRPLTFDHDRTHFSYMLFIELLKQIPPTKQAKDLMLNKCKDYYRVNQQEIELIEQFRNSYTSNQAIDWYTRECFVYRLVNRAFRTEDIILWYLFRYFIIDLCTQLERVHKEQNIKSLLTVYCGQAHMPMNEFENIKSNIGCLISTNGFLSTSTNIRLAKEFIDGAIDSENFKVVMFEITVDGSNLENTIFVDIDQYTKLIGENEVLFNIGSVFKIENVDYDVNMKAWIIKIKAIDEGTHEIKARIDAKKREFHQKNINLMFGRLLLDMNEYTKAESYFQMMLRVLPKSHEDLPLVYDHIGDLNMKTSNWNAALTNFNLAYEIKKKTLPINHPLLGATFNNLGNYYKAIGDYMKALEYYEKAFQCQNDRLNMARIQLNIGAIYGITNDHNKALSLCIESRDLLQQIHPCPYNEIIQYQCLISDIYLNQKNYFLF